MAVLRQLAYALLTVLAVSAVTFLATNIKSPEDVARSALGRNAAPEQIGAFVAARDLADPVPVRYTRWLEDFVQGDWGRSVVTDRPVQPELAPRLGRTLLLAGLAFVIVVPLSIALGGYLAQRWGTRRDVTATSGLMPPSFTGGGDTPCVISARTRRGASDQAECDCRRS